MVASPLTFSQLQAIDIATRISACLSITGSLFTLSSYAFYRPLRTPFNRLAVCIAFANLVICIGYSWGMYPLKRGGNSAWCQTQAFLIYCFAMSDPFLVLVMVASVYLRIQARRSLGTIRIFENVGIVCGYAIPFTLALTFLCWRPHGKTIYGSAGTWCFVSGEYNVLRLAAFYGPVWGMLLLSILLFVLSARTILKVRDEVHKVQAHSKYAAGRKLSIPQFMPSWSDSDAQVNKISTNSSPRIPCAKVPSSSGSDMQRVFVSTTTPTNEAQDNEIHFTTPVYREDTMSDSLAPTADRSSLGLTPTSTTEPLQQRRPSRWDAGHWKYARFAFLCTLVLCITWIPVSINRVYNGFFRPNDPEWGLYFASALCSPLHGFGNSIVYINTSWTECRTLVLSLFSWLRRRL